jgi:hypothetical protein
MPPHPTDRHLITGAGFTLDRLETYDAPGGPKPFSWFYEGVARA